MAPILVKASSKVQNQTVALTPEMEYNWRRVILRKPLYTVIGLNELNLGHVEIPITTNEFNL